MIRFSPEKLPIPFLQIGQRLKLSRAMLEKGALLALMTILCSSRLLGELAPFAAAFFAAALAEGASPLALIIGCLVHVLLTCANMASLVTLAGCLMIALLHRPLTRLIKPHRKRGLREITVALSAALGVLIPGLAVSGGLPFNLLTSSLSAAIAALLAPSILPALTLRSLTRRRYLPEERLSAALLALMLLIALGSSPFLGLFSAQCAAVLLTLLCASQGAGCGAAGGVATAAALALGTGLSPAGSALALSGLLAGCVSMLPRPAAALALSAGNMLALTQGIGFTPGRIDPLPLFIGGLIYCLFPTGWLSAVQRLIKGGEDLPPDCSPVQRALARRLERLSRVFETLADGYTADEALPAESELVLRLRGRLCSDCPDYARCWEGDHPEDGRLMCRLISEALGGRCVPLCERSPELTRHCRRSTQIDRRLAPLLSELAEHCRITRQRGDIRNVVSGQLRQCASFLNELSQSAAQANELNPTLMAAASAALEKAGYAVQHIYAVSQPRPEITAALQNACWTEESARRASEALSDALGYMLMPSRPYGQMTLRFLAAPRLHVRAGLSITPLHEGEPCGDTAHIGLLPDGRLLAVLSDGMGSGERAASESRRTIRLIRTFLEAGLDSARSLEAINALLQLQSGELFATVDLCLMDLQSGAVSLSKLGACSSLLIRDGQAYTLPGGHLPIGILEKIEPGEQRFAVRPGDTLILCSDGIADDLREGQLEWLKKAALEAGQQPPQALAQALRKAALTRQGGRPGDDMSVLVLQMARHKDSAPSAAQETPQSAAS